MYRPGFRKRISDCAKLSPLEVLQAKEVAYNDRWTSPSSRLTLLDKPNRQGKAQRHIVSRRTIRDSSRAGPRSGIVAVMYALGYNRRDWRDCFKAQFESGAKLPNSLVSKTEGTHYNAIKAQERKLGDHKMLGTLLLTVHKCKAQGCGD